MRTRLANLILLSDVFFYTQDNAVTGIRCRVVEVPGLGLAANHVCHLKEEPPKTDAAGSGAAPLAAPAEAPDEEEEEIEAMVASDLAFGVAEWHGWRCSWRAEKKDTSDFKRLEAKVLRGLKSKAAFFSKVEHVLLEGSRHRARNVKPVLTRSAANKKAKAKQLAKFFRSERKGGGG